MFFAPLFKKALVMDVGRLAGVQQECVRACLRMFRSEFRVAGLFLCEDFFFLCVLCWVGVCSRRKISQRFFWYRFDIVPFQLCGWLLGVIRAQGLDEWKERLRAQLQVFECVGLFVDWLAGSAKTRQLCGGWHRGSRGKGEHQKVRDLALHSQ